MYVCNRGIVALCVTACLSLVCAGCQVENEPLTSGLTTTGAPLPDDALAASGSGGTSDGSGANEPPEDGLANPGVPGTGDDGSGSQHPTGASPNPPATAEQSDQGGESRDGTDSGGVQGTQSGEPSGGEDATAPTGSEPTGSDASGGGDNDPVAGDLADAGSANGEGASSDGGQQEPQPDPANDEPQAGDSDPSDGQQDGQQEDPSANCTGDGACDDGLAETLDVCDVSGCCVSRTVSYAEDMQPIFAAKCAPCHAGQDNCAGGLCVANNDVGLDGPSTTCAGLTKAECIAARVQEGSMPPKKRGCTGDPAMDAGNDACLTAEEHARLAAWVAAGAP